MKKTTTKKTEEALNDYRTFKKKHLEKVGTKLIKQAELNDILKKGKINLDI